VYRRDRKAERANAHPAGFMARSAPGVDAVSGLGFPLLDIPL
jgi:hypothetical protein